MKNSASIHNQASKHLFILSLAILNIIIAFDGYMYFAASKEIIEYFHIQTQQIDNITKANFSGILVGSFLISFIINRFNKKHLLFLATALFMLSKIVCVITSNFYIVILCNFFSGIANSFPPTIIVLLLMQRYSEDVANNALLLLDIFVCIISLTIPIATEYLVGYFGWKISFIFPSILGLLSFFTTNTFIHDLDALLENRKPKKDPTIKEVLRKYFTILKNIRFLTFAMIACLYMITSTMRQVSIPILLSDLHVPLFKFSLGKEFILIMNIIFSYMAIKLTDKKGIVPTTNIGFITIITGVLLFSIACYYEDVRYVFLTTIIVVAGECLTTGFAVRAIASLNKENQGMGSSVIVMIGSVLSIRAATLSQRFFDEQMLPNALIMLYYVLISVVLFIVVYKRDKKLHIKK